MKKTCLLPALILILSSLALPASVRAEPAPIRLTLLGAYAHAFPGGNLLPDLDAGPGLTLGLQATLSDRIYLKLEGAKLDPGIVNEQAYIVADDQKSALLTTNYDYRDVCLLAGANLGLPRVGRPHLYLEAGGGIGIEEYDRTRIDLVRGDRTPVNPDLVFFVLAVGAGVKFPVHRQLAVDLGLSLRLHWDTDPGTGFFDPLTGAQVPVEEFEGSSTMTGTMLAVRVGAAWALF